MAESHFSLVDDLARAFELLTPEKLKPFSDEADDGAARSAIKLLTPTEVAVAALAFAGHEDTAFRESIEEKTGQDLARIYEHLHTYAPRLLIQPHLIDFAQRIKSRLKGSQEADAEEEEEPPLYHDLESVRATVHYLGGTQERVALVPMTRFDIQIAGAASLTLQLRLADAIFLADALLAGLCESLVNVRAVHQKGLLQPAELEGLPERLRDLEKNMEQVRAKVQELSAKP